MVYKNRHRNRLEGARLKNHDLSTETYNLPHDLWGYKHVGMISAHHYLLRILLNMIAIYGGQEENLRFLKTIRLINCRLSKYSVRKDTVFGPCQNIRRTIPSGLFEQGMQKSVNKQTKKRLREDHPSGVNICQRASRKSLTIKTQTNGKRVLRCAWIWDFNCAGFWMREDRKNIALKDDSYVGHLLRLIMRFANKADEVSTGVIRPQNGAAIC